MQAKIIKIAARFRCLTKNGSGGCVPLYLATITMMSPQRNMNSPKIPTARIIGNIVSPRLIYSLGCDIICKEFAKLGIRWNGCIRTKLEAELSLECRVNMLHINKADSIVMEEHVRC